MFIDASAIVAILNQEPEGEALEACIERTDSPVAFSPIVRFEAIVSLARARAKATGAAARPTAETLAQASASVDLFFDAIEAEEVPITVEIGRIAVAASARFGKVVGHPADLNFGDCFVYAGAKARDDALLFVGADFAMTDLRNAASAGSR
jgi:ribonuclease VapC